MTFDFYVRVLAATWVTLLVLFLAVWLYEPDPDPREDLLFIVGFTFVAAVVLWTAVVVVVGTWHWALAA